MPTPIDGASRVQACALRVARLAADGSTPAGASNMYANKRFVKVTTTPVYETGEELTLKTACGALDVSYKARDIKKRRTAEIELTYPDPEALELMTGGAVLVDGTGNTIGFQEPHVLSIPNPNGVSLEVWEKAIIVDHQTTPGYFRFAYPRGFYDYGEVSHENKPGTVTLTGFMIENPTWGNGPNNDFTTTGAVGGTAIDTTAISQWIRDPALPATLTSGYQATPVQA